MRNSSAERKYAVVPAQSEEDIAAVRLLFREYADSIGFSLCFQGFEDELAGLPGDYAPPSGRLLLAKLGREPAGCAALHSFSDGVCEMKRLYARPAHRGAGLGRLLCETLIAEARVIGYKAMRLDTVEPRMRPAVALYREFGFKTIAPYRANPIPGALYMQLDLRGPRLP